MSRPCELHATLLTPLCSVAHRTRTSSCGWEAYIGCMVHAGSDGKALVTPHTVRTHKTRLGYQQSADVMRLPPPVTKTYDRNSIPHRRGPENRTDCRYDVDEDQAREKKTSRLRAQTPPDSMEHSARF